MIVRDNKEIQKQVKNLVKRLDDAVDCIEHLDKLADARYEEVDAVDEIANFDKIIFNMRAVMFNAKIELEKIQKAMHKHVAHTLNPIAKTAPKGEKSISARKKKDASEPYNDLEKALKAPVKNNVIHSTINRGSMITKGDAPIANPHDKPFDMNDNDIPF